MKWSTRNKDERPTLGDCFRSAFVNGILAVGTLTISVSAGAVPAPKNIHGVAVTGLNRLLGNPVANLGGLGAFGFDTVAAFNPEGTTPLPVSTDSPGDTLLATTVDSAFLEAFYGDAPFSVDPASINVPIRDVPTNTTPANDAYKPLKGALETTPYRQFSPGQAEPVYPLTLARWLQARGLATIQCSGEERATVDIIMGGLIPNRIYSVWGLFTPPGLTFPVKDFGPILPLGGAPNLFVSDKNGSGRFKRTLNFCPTLLEDDDVPMAAFFVAYHSDLMANGGVPTFPERSRFPGTSAQIQLQFTVN